MNRLYNIACFLALVLAVCITAATLVGTLAQQWWIGELLSHPRPQYALILLCCLPLIVARFHQLGWLVLIPLLLNLITFAPLYFSKPLPVSAPSFTALHYNLDATLPDHTVAFTYLRNHPVDILLLLKKEGLLLSSESGYGVQSTWPAYLPPVLGIPIDLCLYSQGIAIVDRYIGSFLGGDHRPLFIQFQL
ncbi:hypothetical protein [Coleofasciculus sp.]|uniref:hypothetical protein n=1 Tax=Coleofasciculus sp. TaxID=3100458 RepID=UPI0039FB4FFC